MAEQLWSDERIEQEINKAARELIVYDTKLASYVVPQVRRVALDIFADMGAALDAANQRVRELERELAETRTRLSGAESAWDTIENLMMGVDDDE